MDLIRDKFLRLMEDIQDLEDQLEKGTKSKTKKAGRQDKTAVLQNELAAKRHELARISDGCGKPHGIADSKPRL